MSRRVRVNPIACEAHGMCAELLPERITLDEWGYPIVDERPLDGELRRARHAGRAGLPDVRAARRTRTRARAPGPPRLSSGRPAQAQPMCAAARPAQRP